MENLFILAYHIVVFGSLFCMGAAIEKLIDVFKKRREKKAAEILLKRKAANAAELRRIGDNIRRTDMVNRFAAECTKADTPIRKACGLFSNEDAQAILK